jgi:hypothetical protein
MLILLGQDGGAGTSSEANNELNEITPLRDANVR